MHTPRYEYSKTKIRERVSYLMGLSTPFGLTVRYALKANPHPEILQMMHETGIHFDTSSSYEASELLALGIPGNHISLSSQQSPHNLPELLESGVLFVATSLKQLDLFLAIDTESRPNTVAVRINPPVGHGHNNRTTTGGANASFGIWYEYADTVLPRTEAAGVTIDRMHIHIGSGADPKVWGDVMDNALRITKQFPDVISLDIGGGYKVRRYGEEEETDMEAVFKIFSEKLTDFSKQTGRNLALEIEPGTYAIAHAGTLVASIDDIVDTGKDGNTFIRLNTGMNDFLRSALYGARHEIEVVNDATTTTTYVVVGHNCESGDIFTPEEADPERMEARELRTATIGDEVRIRDVGAYCASMRATGYNSFPDAIEIMVD
jgi:diaminopimelate decarboxylase